MAPEGQTAIPTSRISKNQSKIIFLILVITPIFIDNCNVNFSQTLKQLTPYQIVIYWDIEIFIGCCTNTYQYAKLPKLTS